MSDAGADAARVPLVMAAPMFRGDVSDAPLLFPFLFVTIACGACSGFHCLVSSGTSSKQLRREPDALPIAYGSMLAEGFLAVVVILACVAGLGLGTVTIDGAVVTGDEAYAARYGDWQSAAGLSAKVGAFVDGSANFLRALGMGREIAVAIMGVLVASFAGTTLDTACRLQRYVIQELAGTLSGQNRVAVSGDVSDRDRSARGPLRFLSVLSGKHAATLFAIVTAMGIAILPIPGGERASLAAAVGGSTGLAEAPAGGGWAGAAWWLSTYGGKGGLILWPLFGATNQLLAGLALMVIAFFLWRRGAPMWFVAVPTVFMLLVPAWAMAVSLPTWWDAERPSYVIIAIGAATLALEIWMIVEAILMWPKVRGVLEPPAASRRRAAG